MIRFNCPHCDRPYEVPDALARLPLVCKQCGQRITPPVPDASAPAPPPPPVAAAPPAPAPKLPAPKPVPPAPKPVAPPPPSPAPAAKPVPTPAPAAVPVAPAAVKPVAAPKPPSPVEEEVVTKPAPGPEIGRNGDHQPAALGATRAHPAEHNGSPEPDADESVGDINLDLLPAPALPPAPKPPPPPPAPTEPPEEAPEPTLLPFVADLVVFVLLVVVGLLLGEMIVRKPTGQVLSEAGAAPKFPPVDLLLWGGPALVFGLVYLLLNSRERTVGAWLRRRRQSE